jgi:hypothetical protein
MFHYPLSLALSSLSKTEAWDMMKHFSMLSGLTQYIKRGACVGEIVMLKEVVGYIEGKLRKVG